MRLCVLLMDNITVVVPHPSTGILCLLCDDLQAVQWEMVGGDSLVHEDPCMCAQGGNKSYSSGVHY